MTKDEQPTCFFRRLDCRERWLTSKEIIESTKNCVEITAYIAALVFFVYKVYSGYLVVDMSISLDCERRRKPATDNKDYLGISVALKKGERGGVELHDAQALITSCNTAQVLGPFPLTTIWRINRTEPKSDIDASKRLCVETKLAQALGKPEALRAQLDWTCIPQDVPRLKMPPGDETKLAAFVEVDRDVPYMIEVVVLARRLLLKRIKLRFGQWHAAKVSLPPGD